MAENNSTNQRARKSKSHFRSIAKITNQYSDMSFMPKFIIKNLHSKKQQHRRRPSITLRPGIKIDLEKNLGPSRSGRETRGKIAATDQEGQESDGLMSKHVGGIMSFMFRSKTKSSDKENSLVKQSSLGPKCFKSSSISTFDESSCSSEKTFLRRSLSGLRSMDGKPGLKIKRLTRMLSRERDGKRELCKKKILMGEKCKPLSGMLRYDENGVLVPEDLT